MKSLLILILAFMAMSTLHACDTDELIRCSKEVLPKVTQLANEVLNDMGEDNLNQEQSMDKVCKVVREYTRCLKPALVGCPEDQVNMMMKQLDNLNKPPYNCGPSENGYKIKDESCQNTEMARCMNVIMPHMKEITQMVQNDERPSMKGFCRMFDQFTQCIMPILNSCDQLEAENYVIQFSQYNEPPYNCNIPLSLGGARTRGEEKPTPNEASATLCTQVSLLLMVFSLLAFVFK